MTKFNKAVACDCSDCGSDILETHYEIQGWNASYGVDIDPDTDPEVAVYTLTPCTMVYELPYELTPEDAFSSYNFTSVPEIDKLAESLTVFCSECAEGHFKNGPFNCKCSACSAKFGEDEPFFTMTMNKVMCSHPEEASLIVEEGSPYPGNLKYRDSYFCLNCAEQFVDPYDPDSPFGWVYVYAKDIGWFSFD